MFDSVEDSSSRGVEMRSTDQLSAFLDNERNKQVARELDIAETTPSKVALAKVLDRQSFVSSGPLMKVLSSDDANTGYRTIGFGQCGIIFERPGYNYVLKVARPHFEDALWSDFVCHSQIWKAFQSQDLTCRVPRLFSYVPKTNTNWWNKNMPLFSTSHSRWQESFPLPAMTLISERILPLPNIVRQVLIDEYCPQALQPGARLSPSNRDCLARLYLGRRRPKEQPPSPNFTLRNFNLHLDQMLELGLDVTYFAATIGEALAVIHWSARVDAYDVEFVLGSDRELTYFGDLFPSLGIPTTQQFQELKPHTDLESMIQTRFPRLATRPWVLDFNLCGTWKEEIETTEPDALISQLVLAFFENDPYYPIPLADREVDQSLWNVFSTSYLEMADNIVSGRDPCRASLPHKFIVACIERERDSLERGLGHGHREFKG